LSEETVILYNKGMKLVGRVTVPQGEPSACVVLFHGFSGYKDESGQLFVHAARKAVELSMGCVRFDFRYSKTDKNASESDGSLKGMLPSEWISDAKMIVAEARRRFPDSKVGAIGLSMGGLVAINVAAQGLLDALVTWSAPVDQGRLVSISRIVDFVRSGAVNDVKAFSDDISRCNPIKVASKLVIPVLAVAGELDDTVPPDQARLLFEAAQGGKSIYVVGGADHVFSKQQAEVIGISMAWLSRFLQS